MIDIAYAIFGIIFMAALLGSIPYGIWMILTAIKRRWKRLGLQILIPTIVLFLMTSVSWKINAITYKRDLAGYYDTDVELGKPIYEYDSNRSFNGDGYSLSVYEMPASIRIRFEAADESLLSHFPKRPNFRQHWKATQWRRSPFDENFSEYLDFATIRHWAEQDSELKKYYTAIQTALRKDGSFYAFFYNRPSSHLGDVDFFIVDLIQGRLYSINHNT